MSRLSAWAVALAMGLLVSGCYNDFGPVVPGDLGEPVAPSPLNITSRIQAGDKIRLIVYGEDTLSGLYEVSPSGMLSLPLIGTISAVGRSRA